MTELLQNKQKEFAIVGGGSSGPIAVIYLAKEFKKRAINLKKGSVTIHAYDPNRFCNGGPAYGNSEERYKLNSVYGEMSPWNPSAFFNFAQEKTPGIDPMGFSSRTVYLDFLKKEYKKAVSDLAERGVIVREHQQSVNKLELNRTAGTVALDTQDQGGSIKTLPTDSVLPCVGNGPNGNFPDLQQHIGSGYVHNFYDLKQMESEPGFKKDNPFIFFIGNGPALYDFVNAYTGDPSQINLCIIAPNGKLLDVRDVSAEKNEKTVNVDLIKVIPASASLGDLDKAIKLQFEKAATDGATPRRTACDIINALRSVLKRVSLDVAQAFNNSSSYSSLVHRATPVPADSHARLLEFNPTVIKGRFNQEHVNKNDDDSFTIEVGSFSDRVDVIVNGTGHGRTNHPIIIAMIKDGSARVDPRFGVLETLDDGIHLRGSGIPFIGPGAHWGIDGIETFARLVEPLAMEWTDNIEAHFKGSPNLAHNATKGTEGNLPTPLPLAI